MESIKIIGAKMHNLKNINVEIPRDKLVVITGVSGSGKSSLAFDTIYAEGQRRYVESLSVYARQFLQLAGKPDVESIEGLSPAIAIDQKSISKNPRSTVGTITEIYDYLRLIYAKIGQPHCPKCGKIIKRHNITTMLDEISNMKEGTKLMILAPIVIGKQGTHIKTLERIEKEGFVRFRIDGEVKTIADRVDLDENIEHNIEIVVDRIVVKDLGDKFTVTSKGEKFIEINPNRTRIADSLELAMKHGEGFVHILNTDNDEEVLKYSNKFHCEDHNEICLPAIEPKCFSFNSPHGACEKCHGLGQVMQIDENLIIPNKNLTISEGALHPWSSYDIDKNINYKLLAQVAKKYKFDFKVRFNEIPEKIREIIIYGSGEEKFAINMESDGFTGKMSLKYNGVANYIQRKYEEGSTEFSKTNFERYMHSSTCTKCQGRRLKDEILGITIGDKNIIDITQMSINDVSEFFDGIEEKMTFTEKKIANKISGEIKNRLKFLTDVGLSYLTLNRGADTLSGGEGQRIRLATQIGSALQGVLYVLDEPSIGLHQKDNDMLIATMRYLKNLGNTVLVVEHDEDTIRAADYIIEIGPKAGKHGGELVAQGVYDEIVNNENSITGKYLSGKLKINIPKIRRKGNGKLLELIGARGNNLRNVHARIPLGCFVGISGVSGSGKSSLINQTLVPELIRMLNNGKTVGLEHDEIKGTNNLDKIISIDQSPIGKTPKSNPATYTGVFTLIRDLYSNQPESKLRGYKSGRFSFNVKGGRCEDCSGDGVKKIEMYFLPDVFVTCETCNSKRYNRETLEITFRGKNIAEILDMTVSEALEFFNTVPKIKLSLQTLENVGLGYIHLGQPSTQLSGGEAQRVKLSSELSRVATGKTIYVLDEPTTGLHFDDINKLLMVLQSLVDKGNSILIIEHNIDVLKTCDYLIDLGLDGGDGGGEIIVEGTPEEVAKNKISYTAKWLNKILK